MTRQKMSPLISFPRTKEDISRVVNEFMTGGMTITGDEIELPESFLRAPTTAGPRWQ